MSTNSYINYSDIHLMPATLAEHSIIQNMGRFYVYDMSEHMGFEPGWEIPADGLYECIDFKKYWTDSNAFPYLIYYNKELAGFVIVDKKGSNNSIEFNMAQFFILRKFKNKGVGRYIAFECFNTYKGIWEVMVLPGNTGAYQFWQSIIKQYTQNNYQTYMRRVAHLNDSKKNIFCFDTKITPSK